ncbi:josephin-like protein isoform X1 [Dioscorea cayenensis subsp. rotundata]|uniref:ubiquitinyl hydrolase 1 n=1 Tax=Dioscorea cayennensis subsp. rotundata TaxID=55577 RepID=A0AB40D0J1_DIOCR|nr:josephin-like protein isoform X1 [Dioscorea cayenensis subsp. rotundata]
MFVFLVFSLGEILPPDLTAVGISRRIPEKDAFTRAELDAIADKLVLDDVNKDKWTPFSFIFKPHHNILTGNYDVNVLIAALEAKGKKVVWHDHRTGSSSIKLVDDSLTGMMLNVPTKKFGGLWRSRHWVAFRKIHGIWYNLDSDLKAGKPFQNDEHVLEYLDNIISQGGQVFIILHEKCSL